MTAHPCPCCNGTGQLEPDTRPLCATATQQRDPRSPAQLRRYARLQQLALRDIAYTRDGQPLPEHDDAYVDYRTGAVVA